MELDITQKNPLLASLALIQTGATSNLKTKDIMVIPALLRQYFKGVRAEDALSHTHVVVAIRPCTDVINSTIQVKNRS